YQLDPHGNAVPSQTLTTYNQWIWEVPFSAYTANQANLTFLSEADLDYGVYNGLLDPPYEYQVPVFITSMPPLPFADTCQLGEPSVTRVSPPTVKPGATLTIVGTALDPSAVQAVLIGGQALSPANFKPISDTQIQVVAPNTPGPSQSVVVQTSQGTSNSNVTI